MRTTTTGQSPRRIKRASSDRVCASDARKSRRIAKENETRNLPHGSKPRSPGMEPSNQAGRTAPGLQSYRFEKKTARFQRQSHTHTARDRRFPRVASRRVPRDSDRAKERTLRRRNRRASARSFRDGESIARDLPLPRCGARSSSAPQPFSPASPSSARSS